MVQKLSLALFDVDGTLRNAGRWNRGTIELLSTLHEHGVKIALCSGRTTTALTNVVADLPYVDHVASSSGATVLARRGDDWEVAAHRPVPREAVERALETAEELGVEVWAFTEHEWLLAKNSTRSRIEAWQLGEKPRVADLHAHSDHYGKVLFRCDTDEQVESLKAVNRVPGTAVVLSGHRYLDLVADAAHDAKGGDVILEMLGIPWSETLAMGDGENDAGMLAQAGLAICVPPMRVDLLPAASSGQLRFDVRDTREALELVRDQLG